ncbi:hypothetical protein JXA84_04035 [candidate division WOR-3 bacterium]|nr:hypothetical protein [candidate division WOR-3 bacterium]
MGKKKYIKPQIRCFEAITAYSQLFSNESPEGVCTIGTVANACQEGGSASGGPGQCLSGSTANFDCLTGSYAQGSVCSNGDHAANQGGQCKVGMSPK